MIILSVQKCLKLFKGLKEQAPRITSKTPPLFFHFSILPAKANRWMKDQKWRLSREINHHEEEQPPMGVWSMEASRT